MIQNQEEAIGRDVITQRVSYRHENMKEKKKGYQKLSAVLRQVRRYHELLPHATENRLAEMNGFVARTPRVSRCGVLGFPEFKSNRRTYCLFQAPSNGKLPRPHTSINGTTMHPNHSITDT